MASTTNRSVTRVALVAALNLLLQLSSVSAESPDGAQVSIEKFKFIPQEITVNVGDTVRWTNNEKRQYHSVWFEQAGDPEPPYIFPGETSARTFDQPGTFPYRCGPHPEMTAVVHVK